MTTESNINNKQYNADNCWCKKVFNKDNLFLKCIAVLAIVVISYCCYNKIDEWMKYRKLEKLIAGTILVTDDFGFTVKSINTQLADIDNKMLLCYLAKQQTEILKSQQIINEKLNKLFERTEGEAAPQIIPVNKAVETHSQQQQQQNIVPSTVKAEKPLPSDIK